MRRAERNDETVFERQWHIESDKGTRSFAKVAYVVLAVSHIVLDDHVSVANTIILVLLDHKVVIDFTFRAVLERSEDRAPVVFAALRADQPLRVDIHRGATVGLGTLDHFDAETVCFVNLVEGHHDRTQRQIGHSIGVLLFKEMIVKKLSE